MKKVRWVIQNNMIAEHDLNEIVDACKAIGVEYEEVQIIPFSKEIPEFTIDEDTINLYYGGTTFIDNIFRRYNRPIGVFFDTKNFSMENYMKKWGVHMLNSDAKVTTLNVFSNELHADDSLWFIRPDADDKSFAGNVMSFDKIKNWKDNIQTADNFNLTADTKIIVGPPYNIRKEWRNYIVDGVIVDSSLYRQDFKLKKSNTDIPEDMLQFVKERLKEYMPFRSFAMDIAWCGDSYYIIECGCINSVGFYAADVSKILGAITASMVKEDPDLTKVRWKVETCNTGEACWCRTIIPETPVFDAKGRELDIATDGDLSKDIAEYIVKIHNEEIERKGII